MFIVSLKKGLPFLLLFCFLIFLVGCAAKTHEQTHNTSLDHSSTSSTVEDETTVQSGNISLQSFTLPGLHYYDGMDVVNNKDQQDYMLDLSFVDIENETISVKGDISHNGKEAYALSASGKLFRSSIGGDEELKSDVIVAILNSGNELVMLSCLIFETPHEALLFPANSDYAGKPLMIFVLMAPDHTVLFFSAPLPENFHFDSLYKNLPSPDSSRKISIDAPGGYEIPEDSDEWPLNEIEAVERAMGYNAFAFF